MENKNKNLINEQEQMREQENVIREEEELEFISSDVDVDDYSVPTDVHTEIENKAEDAAESSVAADGEPVATIEDHEEMEDEDDGDEASPSYLVKLVLTLAAICMVIALLLSFVNNITKDRISENVAKQQQAAILSIFPEGTGTEEYITADGETVYIVNKNGDAIGYCVNSMGTGFGGPVQVMVGFKTDKTVKGIKIVSMSETPGIGTKVQGDSFLSQFLGIDKTDDVDIISGATFSSKAVIEAVENAMEIEVDLESAKTGEQELEPVDEVEANTCKDYVDEVNVPVIGNPEITDSTVVFTVEVPERENEYPWEGFVPDGEEQN